MERLSETERLRNLMDRESDLKTALVKELTTKASGVFLWVKLVIDDLTSGAVNRDSVDELRERVRALPSELGGPNGLYMCMLHDHSVNKAQGLHIMRMVQLALSPLTPLDLHFAENKEELNKASTLTELKLEDEEVRYRVKEMEGRVQSRCAYLLESWKHENDSLPHLQFIHQTAKDFAETSLSSLHSEYIADMTCGLLGE